MRLRTWLFLGFVLVPIIEIMLFYAVGSSIGLWPTVLIVVITAFVGSWLVSRQGRATWLQFRTELAAGGVPTKPLVHGAMILVAGGYHTPIVRRTMEPVSGTMSNMVTARPVVSFKMMHDGGAAYVTYSIGGSRETTTGELELSSINVEAMPKWTVKIEPFGVHYRGHYSVGTITPSPPARPAED